MDRKKSVKRYMSTPETHLFLTYIRDAADLIEEFVGARTFSEYERDAMLRSAVERQFINIGESVNLLSRADSELASSDNRLSAYHRFSEMFSRTVSSMYEMRPYGIMQPTICLFSALK